MTPCNFLTSKGKKKNMSRNAVAKKLFANFLISKRATTLYKNIKQHVENIAYLISS